MRALLAPQRLHVEHHVDAASLGILLEELNGSIVEALSALESGVLLPAPAVSMLRDPWRRAGCRPRVDRDAGPPNTGARA